MEDTNKSLHIRLVLMREPSILSPLQLGDCPVQLHALLYTIEGVREWIRKSELKPGKESRDI